jgi:hypothetical protein|tara:strand:- start:251 stop:412 length:162 start_codon:yes stop_codon:yes gene_type:complete
MTIEYPNKYGVKHLIHRSNSKKVTVYFDDNKYAIAFALTIFDVIKLKKKRFEN